MTFHSHFLIATRFTLISAAMAIGTAIAVADEPSKEVQQLRDEVRALKIQNARLRAQVRLLKRSQQSAQVESKAWLPLYNSKPTSHVEPDLPVEAAEVLELQRTSPTTLLRNVHLREMMLRRRHFPADNFSLMP